MLLSATGRFRAWPAGPADSPSASMAVNAGLRIWFLTAVAQMTATQKPGIFHLVGTDATGKPYSFVSPFANPAGAQAAFVPPLPGQVGSRNVLRAMASRAGT